jgi:hypothetical protein
MRMILFSPQPSLIYSFLFFLARAFSDLFLRAGHFCLFHRPLSFSCPPLSCTVLGDCLSKQVVLQGAVFSLSKLVGEYQLVIQAISPSSASSVVFTLRSRTLSITTLSSPAGHGRDDLQCPERFYQDVSTVR